MIGKLVGKAVGVVIALPATLAAETVDAIDAASVQIGRAVDKATEPKR